MADDHVVFPTDLVVTQTEQGGLCLTCAYCGVNVLDSRAAERHDGSGITLATLLDSATRHALGHHAGWFPGWTAWPEPRAT